jgi:RNA polymerase sigma factor (sigma-70 family)
MENAEPPPPTLAAEPADADLLRRFVARRDEAAFALLVQRYGPLVLGVCTRVLDHRQDAEDALQTTFLVLARKAKSITRRESVCGWIYRVAFRIALKARAARARRARHEAPLPDVPAPEETPAWVWRDLRPILDEEVSRLPRKYRLPFILCYLEGQTNAQAAATLHCPPGTVMSRLAWARERLRARLALRGVTLSTGVLAAVLTEQATASALPAMLAGPTIANALRFAVGQAGEVAAHLAGPAEEFLRALFWTQVRRISVLVLALGGIVALSIWLAIGGIGLVRPGNPKGVPPPAVVVPDDQARIQGTWLPERIEGGGQVLPPDGLKVAFSDNIFQLIPTNGQPLTLQFELNPTAQPPTIDLYEASGLFSRGIYRLEGDSLLICYARAERPRPRQLDGSAPRTILYQLKRETALRP